MNTSEEKQMLPQEEACAAQLCSPCFNSSSIWTVKKAHRTRDTNKEKVKGEERVRTQQEAKTRQGNGKGAEVLRTEQNDRTGC